MFKKFRIFILSAIFLYLCYQTYVDLNPNWDGEQVIVLHPVNMSNSAEIDKYISNLKQSDFDDISKYLSNYAEEYRKNKTSIKFELGRKIDSLPPAPTEEIAESMWRTILWSLKFKIYGYKNMKLEDLGASAVLYLTYYDMRDKNETTRSTALQRGRIGMVTSYANEGYEGQNNMVIAHESLHLYGALDRYDPSTGVPNFPEGYADPKLEPLFPQVRAEIMGGYIPISNFDIIIPDSLNKVVIHKITAKELGWID